MAVQKKVIIYIVRAPISQAAYHVNSLQQSQWINMSEPYLSPGISSFQGHWIGSGLLSGLGLHCIFRPLSLISESQTCICQAFIRYQREPNVYLSAFQMSIESCNHNLDTSNSSGSGTLHQNYQWSASAFWTSDEAREAAEGRMPEPDSEFPTGVHVIAR